MNDTYGRGRDFRIKILALMLDNAWMARYGTAIIIPEYFDQTDEEATAKAILTYRERYNGSPRDMVDLKELAGDTSGGLIDEVYEIYHNSDKRLAGDIAIQFAKEQAAKLAILESVDDVKAGNLSKPIQRMVDALKVGDSLLSPGLDPIADADKWLRNYWRDKVATGWTHVDDNLEGGLGGGELGCILAPQNRGKSMGLINLDVAAASIVGGGRNVVHFSHEMYAAQVCKRISARVMFRFPKREDNLNEYAEDLYLAARKLIPGKIRVIDGPQTIRSIEAHIERLIAEDFNPGLIVDDYGDLIIPEKHYSERRFEISASFEALRNIGGKYNVPVWTASQATRASHSKEIITMEDMAEDIGKVSISDVIISLNQTYDEEQANQCRLFMAKVRDAKGRACYSAKFYGDCQAIITTGLVERREKDA
jgi:replicative DNA helicase